MRKNSRYITDSSEFEAYLASKKKKRKKKKNISIEKKEFRELEEKSFRNVRELEIDGFYFNPNYVYCDDDDMAKNKECELSNNEYIKKYCYINNLHLNENKLFVSPKKIIDFELNRLKMEYDKNINIDISSFILLSSIIGYDFLLKIMRCIDRKYVKQIRSTKLNRIFYSVLNENAINRKKKSLWKRKHEKNRRIKERKKRILSKMENMTFIAAQQFALKQKQKEDQEWKEKLKKLQKEIDERRRLKKLKIKNKNKMGLRKYKIIKCCKKSRDRRKKMAISIKKYAERNMLDDIEDLPFHLKKKRIWEIKMIKKLKKKENIKKLKQFKKTTVEQRKKLRMNAMKMGFAQNRKIWPRYKNMKCRRKKSRNSSNLQFAYNVFIGHNNNHFCQCNKYKNILRRLYLCEKAKDIEIEQEILPFCKHIIAVKIALILNRFDIVNESEENWSRRAVEHITNNIV